VTGDKNVGARFPCPPINGYLMYPLKLHKNLTPEKWAGYSKGQQILMIANELNRAKNWIKKNQRDETNQCYERAFELIDLTTEDLKWMAGIRELLRCREVLAELYMQQQKNGALNHMAYECLIALSSEAYNLMH
jgi:hypothetical protein